MKYKNQKWLILILLLSLIEILYACKHEPVIPNNPEISFQSQVLPIIRNNCTTSGCHAGYSRLKSLVYYDNIMLYVTPGNASKSDLYKRITKLNSDKMPVNGNLSESQILIIYTWIMQGASNN
jgi:hypothetical protein